MNWNEGYTAKYYAAVVDPVTWRDVDRIEITGGNITRSDDDLRGCADIDCVNYEQGKERWIRLYMDASQNEESVHVPLFTGIASSPDKSINGTLITNGVQLYSVLKPAEDVILPRGYYAAEGANGGLAIKTLLKTTPAPVEVADNAPALTDAIIAEDGETNLTMAEKVLTAIDWRFRITGDGTISVEPKATEPSALFDSLENDSIEPTVDVEYDWYACPNVFMAMTDTESCTVRDDDDASPLSTINRGREIWKQESSVALGDNESLRDYAVRRLKEEQRIACKLKYARRYNPEVIASDLVRLHYPAQDIDGVYYVTSQTISLGYGGTTSEEVTSYE